MLTALQNWKGEVEIDNVCYKSINDALQSDLKHFSDTVHIRLYTKHSKRTQRNLMHDRSTVEQSIQYKITVKAYMTREATPEFDFMAKWNNDKPMPLRTMIGTVEKETPGMVYMKLHGEAEPVIRCMRCGRTLTNPISQHYGIGPECMSKLGLVCDITDVDTIKKKLVDVVWEGWIIRSSIIEKEEI